MKAITYDKYGSPDVLQLQEIDKPVVNDDEVLVRVRAAAVHPGDWLVLTGQPHFIRLIFGLRRPRKSIPGFDLAGNVEAVGKNTTEFQPGDEVFGGCKDGTCAEYVSVSEDALALKPAGLTFEQAGAVPTSGVAALRTVRDGAKVQAEHTVLINGASGGVGTFAVQIAKSLGAEVTGVCSERNADMVRSIGADHVIDYTQEDFAQGEKRYDFILDNVGNYSLSDLRRLLTPSGTLIPNNGTSGGRWFGTVGRTVGALVLSLFLRRQGRPVVAEPRKEDLVALKELIEAGEVTPVIDRTYALSETAEAMTYVGEGHARGKVVITV